MEDAVFKHVRYHSLLVPSDDVNDTFLPIFNDFLTSACSNYNFFSLPFFGEHGNGGKSDST